MRGVECEPSHELVYAGHRVAYLPQSTNLHDGYELRRASDSEPAGVKQIIENLSPDVRLLAERLMEDTVHGAQPAEVD
jgi:hypothetical protein